MPHTEDCKKYVLYQLVHECDGEDHAEDRRADGDQIDECLRFRCKFCPCGVEHRFDEVVPHNEKTVHVLPPEEFNYTGNQDPE